MADVDLRLDSRGIAEVLKSAPVRQEVHKLAEEVADRVRSIQPDADVVVDDYTTDRAASSVTIREGMAALWQARDGILTRAAASAGLEVREKP